MGQPAWTISMQRALNQIGVRREPPELKHLSRARKRNQQDGHQIKILKQTLILEKPMDIQLF